MNIIEELWYGNITPGEKDIKKGSVYAELLEYATRHEGELYKLLDDEGKERLDKLMGCMFEMHDISNREAFVQGFVLGFRISIEAMNTDIR